MFEKDFDNWIKRKKDCHYAIKAPPIFKERDIWWVAVGVNVGFEEDGKSDKFIRPVLVVKKFNREIFLGVPMSTKSKNNKYYVPVTVKGNTVSVMTSQIRVFSSKRILYKLAEIDDGDFKRILVALQEFFVLPDPQMRFGRG